MVNCRHIVALLILIAAALLNATALRPVTAPTGSYGPRSDLRFLWYADDSAIYSALKAGDIDMSSQELTQAQVVDALNDPNIIFAFTPRLDLRAWSLNNNETIAAYPGVTSPMSYADFRKALWCLTDRTYYRDLSSGRITPVYVPIAAPSTNWVNMTVVSYVQNVWAFSMLTAANYLDAGGRGFLQRVGDTNPYYNPSVPGSAQYWRGYPAGSPKAGQRIDPIVFSARVDDELRYAASIHLRDRMLESGIPVNFIPERACEAYYRVMVTRNYHIYSAGWSVGRFATYLYDWLHTSRWLSCGSNYHVSVTSPGYTPKALGTGRPEDFTDLDVAVSNARYPTSEASARAAAENVQSLAVLRYACFIPLWSSWAFYAYRNLFGVTSMNDFGPVNRYTFLSARRADGGTPIRVGLKAPTQLNQIYSGWPWEVNVMEQTMDDYMSMEPYNLPNDQPWLAQDWTSAPGGPSSIPSTWIDPDDGMTKSSMRYWFRDDPNDGLGDSDAEWIGQGSPSAGGGSVLADFTPQWLGGGYEFNCWYFDNEPAGWIYPNYRDIKHVVCDPAGGYADVYFDASSYWSQYWPYGRLLYSLQPASINPSYLGWKAAPLSTQQTRDFAGAIAAGTYLHSLTPMSGTSIPRRTTGAPVEVIEVRIDGVLQTKATTPHLFDPTTGLGAGGDYSIVGGSTNGPSIRIFTAVPGGSTLTVKYWARGDAAGYWPGNMDFQTTLAGTGPWYMTDYVAGAGGWATYKVNTNHFMETPPKGEVDWYWFWISGTQPRDGYYEINIYDVSYLTAAIAHEGSSKDYFSASAWRGVYWLPAADLVLPVGILDIYDMAVLSNFENYGVIFGSPYPNPPP